MPSAAENLMPSEFRSLQNSGTFKVLLSAEIAASFRRYCPDQVIRVPTAFPAADSQPSLP